MLDGASRMSVNGRTLYHASSSSTCAAAYTVANANFVLELNPTSSLVASPLTLELLWEEAAIKIKEGPCAAVIGLGMVEGSRMQGATRIIGIDKNQHDHFLCNCNTPDLARSGLV